MNGMINDSFDISNMLILIIVSVFLFVIVIKWSFLKHYISKEYFVFIVAVAITILINTYGKGLFLFTKWFLSFIKEHDAAKLLADYALLTLIGLIIILTIIYWKPVLQSIKEFWSKDLVLKIVARDFLVEVLNAQSKIKYTSGIKNIIRELKGGVNLYTHHFVKTLSVSAEMKPDVILGCWNTIWYPVDKIFEINSNDVLNINEEWESYFENLDKAYRKSKKRNKSEHKRIFIVNSPVNTLKDLQNNDSDDFLYWYRLLEMHKKWNVFGFSFISNDELESKINSESHADIPQWRDFAIFIKKSGIGLNKYWCFAQKQKPSSEGISEVIYCEGDTVKRVEDFFFSANHWKSKIDLEIIDNKLIITENE
ncbi:MAG: hypothetical protein LWX07_04365 [Bacteroidetes bacterium]|nr:hypothetical protein [Bacteroidota bacterium]